MGVCVFCNLGLRDVQLDQSAIKPARVVGKTLATANDHKNDPTNVRTRDRLTFPIITPSLDYILARHPQGIDQLILFATDQPESEAKHRDNDTLYFADLVKQALPACQNGQVHTTTVKLIQGINPSFYDEALETFNDLLLSLNLTGFAHYYIPLGGGIPACNMALLYHGVRHYGEKLQVLYTPEGKRTHEIRAGRQLQSGFREAAARKHLERLDFANAVSLLADMQSEPGLRHLADYAAARLNFDFATAQQMLDQAQRDGDPSIRAFITENASLLTLNRAAITATGTTLSSEGLLALLRELYWNAAITYDHQRYADFLGRVYRFQEAVLRYLVEHIFGISTDLNPSLRAQTLADWQAAIAAIPALHQQLTTKMVNQRPLDWQAINRPTFQAMLSYAIKKGGNGANGEPLLVDADQKRYQRIIALLNQLDRLVELRHRTIIGHDFQGVSAALLAANFKAEANEQLPVDRLATIIKMLRADISTNPYQIVTSFIQQALR